VHEVYTAFMLAYFRFDVAGGDGIVMDGLDSVISVESSGKFRDITRALLPEDIRQTTDLTAHQVSCAAYLKAVCAKYHMPLVERILDEFLYHRVSLERGSRREYKDVMSYLEGIQLRNTRVVTKEDSDAAEIDSIMEVK